MVYDAYERKEIKTKLRDKEHGEMGTLFWNIMARLDVVGGRDGLV
jgi:hypothetical protein